MMNSKENNQICERNIISTIVTAVGEVIASIVRFVDKIFRPSWVIDAVGCVPVVGNISNFCCAMRAYANGENSLGHQKLRETCVGTVTDISSFGALSRGLNNLKGALSISKIGPILKAVLQIFIDLVDYAVKRIGTLTEKSEFLSRLQDHAISVTELLKIIISST